MARKVDKQLSQKSLAKQRSSGYLDALQGRYKQPQQLQRAQAAQGQSSGYLDALMGRPQHPQQMQRAQAVPDQSSGYLEALREAHEARSDQDESIDEITTAVDREIMPVLQQLRDAFNDANGPTSGIVTSDTTLDAESQYWLVDATSGDVTITLPSAADWSMALTLKKVDSSANSVLVVPEGTDTIELRPQIALDGQFAVVNLWAAPDSGTWYLLNSGGTSYGGFGTAFSTAFDL
jgi:hypothetical protein